MHARYTCTASIAGAHGSAVADEDALGAAVADVPEAHSAVVGAGGHVVAVGVPASQ